MEFRRNASERRRRVLIEENLQEKEGNTGVPARQHQQTPLQNYSPGAQRAHQPHLTDLLPKRRWTLAVLGLLGLVAIAGLQALYGALYVQPADWVSASPAAFDVARSDSLAGWFAAACLAGGSGVASMIFLLRRHRVDDYRGRYRIWIWFAALLLLASMETIAGMRHAAGQWIYGWQPIGNRFTVQACPVLLVGTIVLAALVRGTIEMRRCRTACGALTVATAAYTLVALEEALGWLPACAFRSMVDSTALLLGHYALLGALVVYGRYVYLDAHGCLKVAPKVKQVVKKRAEKLAPKPATESKVTETRRRSDLDKQPEQKPSATITAINSAASTPASTSSADRKLSKSERKKLKRLAG